MRGGNIDGLAERYTQTGSRVIPLSARVTAEDRKVVERAAELAGLTLSAFTAAAAVAAAQRVLAEGEDEAQDEGR